MGYKIAVATSDGVHIDLHFGQTEAFTIYLVNEDGSYEKLGLRTAGAENLIPGDTGNKSCGCGHKKDGRIESLLDCRCVLCAKCGIGAETELGRRHITVFMIQKRIDEALAKIIRYYRNYSSLVSFKHSGGAGS